MESTAIKETSTNQFEILKNPRQREVLKRRTIDLIEKSEDTDSVFFLDQGARPLAYLYSKALTRLQPDKAKPKIGFLNIGSEKTNHVDREKAKKPNSSSDYESIFGKNSLDQLKAYLASFPGKRRIIVDDLQDSGHTKDLALDLTRKVDHESNYNFFTFISDNIDREKFTELDDGDYDEFDLGEQIPYTPWHFGTSLVEDGRTWENPGSFFTRRNIDPEERKKGLQLRKEMDMLVAELET